MNTIMVGGAIPVGEYTEALGAELAELGAVMQRGSGRRPRLNSQAQQLLGTINQRIKGLEQAAAQNAKLRPLLKLTAGAKSVAQVAMNAAAQHRVKATRDYLEQPTHVIPVNFDSIAATTLSGVATVKAPHNQPWRLLAIHCNDNQCNGMRFVSVKLANTEHVVTSNIEWAGAAPTNTGIDAAMCSGKMHKGLMPTFQYRPWGLGRSGWLRSDAELVLQTYNPTTTTQSLNVSILVQSSPCGEGAGFQEKYVLPLGSPDDKRMWRKMAKGLFSFWPRARR